MRREVMGAHTLLRGRTEVVGADFRETLSEATPEDVVYMDPPYQGISEGRDRRYFQGVVLDDLVTEIRRLNDRRIPFLLSYDGVCGDRRYGEELPEELDLTRVMLPAGRSSQATLVGRDEHTIESLYISPAAQAALSVRASVVEPVRQLALYP
jgi:DNA adenine methylase